MTIHDRRPRRPSASPAPACRRAAVVVLALAGGLVLATPAGAAPPPTPSPATASPCAATVKACARLSSDEAWLTDGRGTVLVGPVRMNHGAEGQETPPGRFSVQWKNKDHVSREAGGVPMPYSVFFDGNGRAFHGGDPARQSAGCIRLEVDVARRFFDALQPGDPIEILP